MTPTFTQPKTGIQWATAIRMFPEYAKDCPWEILRLEDWLWLLSAKDYRNIVYTEEMMLLAVSKTKHALQYFLSLNPSEKVLRVHEMKWKL